jgi:hypothetical protein
VREFAILILLITVCVPVRSQHVDRCGFDTAGDVQFEGWLASKIPMGTTQTEQIYRIPVVVHLLHDGDALGEGFNYSHQHVEDQIRTLNEDFRRKEDTPGFNSHPDGADTQIEFVLATVDPDGNPTDGIVRVNMKAVEIGNPVNDIILACSKYSYWDPDHYLNVWSMPLGIPPGLFLGSARFPVSDLPGGFPEDLKKEDGDGVFINAINFGLGSVEEPNYNQGRTLTHEIGHFLGLLHTYSTCDPGDYCNDTPPTASGTHGCPEQPLVACDGRRVMIENYMDVSYDRCMNIFTRDQTTRMHTVLNNSPRRKSLLTSSGLPDPVTGLPEEDVVMSIYPNPVSDKLYISMNEHRGAIEFSIHTLLGTTLKSGIAEILGEAVEIEVPPVQGEMLLLVVKTGAGSTRRLIATR